ncbi:unnamed protein product [Ambrosiozyma monospora]|uniref:Unnamed protein product n=1 Tax=Ambrosiozyma monospora TaxID=43982 RepID=A0ACB5U357_AMBMO|nr:unnamed protein product [Ambrosiozyma monospora]
MSTSSSSEEEADNSKDNNDEVELSVQQLKEKYKDLDKFTLGSDKDSDDEDSDDDDIGSNGATGLAAIYGDEVPKSNGSSLSNGKTGSSAVALVDQLTEEERKQLLEKEANPLFDESSDSGEEAGDENDSDDDTDISDSDDENFNESEHSKDEEDVSDSAGDEQPGLASLFGKQPVEDDSDDESVYSDATATTHNNGEDTPSSSPKEQEKDQADPVDEDDDI